MSLALLPLKIILVSLDLLIAILTFQWIGFLKKLLSSTPLRSLPKSSPSHRTPTEFPTPKTTPYPSVTTLYELSQYAAKHFTDRPAMGSREYLGMHSPKVKKFGGVTYRTYGEVNAQALKFGASLRSAGLVSAPTKATLSQLTTPCTLAIFENTCAEWMIAALGAYSQSISITTVYATLGINAVIDSINDGRIRAILCNKRNVGLLLGKCKEMPTLKHVIYTNDAVAPGEVIEVPSVEGVTVSSFEEFVEGGDVKAFPVVPPSKDTCAVIMYTSGSTGKPKGVVVTHANVTATTTMVTNIINSTDVFLAYLPLAHIFELVAEFSCLACGVCICYADPRTLTATGSYPIGALEQFKPTLLVGVPKIWDIIKKGAEAKIMAGSKLSRFIVATAFEARARARSLGFDTPLFNALVFKKFSTLVGGRLRLAVSGGGPLSSDVQAFISTCFGTWFGQGYGLTETCAGLTLQDITDDRTGIAGVPIPCVEVKLVDCPDINDKAGLPYLSTDTRDVDGNPIFGRGEVWVKGANVGLGYYMMEEKTKEDFDADGFFHTGDIGQYTSDGSLQIVDRKKNLIKLKGGEYIAIENMEMTYANCSFVDAAAGGICCYGDGDMDRPIALIQLNPVIVKNWAKENGISGDVETLKNSKELYDAVMAEMTAIHKRAGLSHIEKLVAVAILTDPWTPENGCLTAANKLQRRAVVEKHDAIFQETKKKGVF